MAHDEGQAATTEDRGYVVQLMFGTLAAHTVRAAIDLRIIELMGDKERLATDVAEEAARPRSPHFGCSAPSPACASSRSPRRAPSR